MHYHNITKDDMLNGEGLRVVLWVAGCSHCCKECHNPSTWDPNGGIYFDQSAKDEIWEGLKKSYIHGITFSGGDPLHGNNSLQVKELAREIKEQFPDKTIWLYTGSVWEGMKEMDIIPYLDVVVDGEFECKKKDENLHWKGSSNQRVIDVKESLKSGAVVLYA
ncbi:MAG: anaerobic ribonucleoside-triphosphate reductase activating protein [Lachnospiraceae bacterium]